MPGRDNIEQFDNTIQGIQPNSRGGEAFAMEGRRVGAFYHQIGQDFAGDIKTMGDAYVEHQTTEELSHFQLNASRFEIGEEINRRQFFSQHGDEPDAVQKYMEGFDERANELVGHLQTERGQAYGAEWISKAREALGMRAIGDAGEMQAATLTNNMAATENNYAALAGMDFTRVPEMLDKVDQLYKTQAPALADPGRWAQLSGERARIAKAGVVMSAYAGLALRAKSEFAETGQTSATYDQTAKMLTASTWFENLNDKEQLQVKDDMERAKSQGLEQYRANATQDQRAQTLQGESALADVSGVIYNSLIPGSPALDTRKTFAALDQLQKQYPMLAEKVDHLRQLTIERAGHDADHTEPVPGGWNTIAARVSVAPGQPGYLDDTTLAQMVNNGQIDMEQAGKAREMRESAKDPAYAAGLKRVNEVIATFKPLLTRSSNPGGVAGAGGMPPLAAIGHSSIDPQGDIAWGIAQQEAQAEFSQIAAKEGPAKAAQVLTDPSNAGYIGNFLKFWQNIAHSPDAAGMAHQVAALRAAHGLPPLPGLEGYGGSNAPGATIKMPNGQSASDYLRSKGL